MGKNKMIAIRFDERTWMLLNELSEKTGANISVIIRSMVIQGIDGIVDESGNLKINERQIQKE